MRALFRRREVWLPTLWGLLVMLIGLAVALVLAVAAVPSLLAVTAKAPGARVLVIEGWLEDPELDQAIAIYRAGHYERIVTTGGPIDSWFGIAPPWKNFAERSARYLAAHGLADVQIDAVGAPASAQDRTFLSAVVVREWVARTEHLQNARRIDAIDVLTVGVHARRSRAMFRAAFGPSVDVGIISVPPRNHELDRWWATSSGAKSVLGESISMVWTTCCFWPPAPGSHEERWAIPGPRETPESISARSAAPTGPAAAASRLP